jgi:hypothetical protein
MMLMGYLLSFSVLKNINLEAEIINAFFTYQR